MNDAQKYLIDNKLNDLVLNFDQNYNDWKYVSDIMEAYHNFKLNLPVVSRSKRVNIITFENNERCFKVSEKNLLNMIKHKRLEKGDTHYKCELVKKY